MKFFLDTEFHEYKKQLRLARFRVSKPINTIELISIGIVAADEREYYAICKDFNVEAAWNDKWLHNNVLRQLYSDLLNLAGICDQTYHFEMAHFNIKRLKHLLCWYGKTSLSIAKEVVEFICGKDQKDFSGISALELSQRYDLNNKSLHPEIYGYYADYDWVIFCWLFGSMEDLPKGFPMYCLDVKQMMDNLGLDEEWKRLNHSDPHGEHSAIVDARWIKELYEKITDNRIQCKSS